MRQHVAKKYEKRGTPVENITCCHLLATKKMRTLRIAACSRQVTPQWAGLLLVYKRVELATWEQHKCVLPLTKGL